MDACMQSAQNDDGLPLRVVAQGLIEEVSWDEVGLWNASDQQEPEEKLDLQPDWQDWERQEGTFHDLLESEVNNSQMGDIGDVQASLSPQQAAADTIPDDKSGDNNDPISFSVVKLDVTTQDGEVPYSQLSGTDGKNGSNGGDFEAENLVRGSGDAAELAASCPSIPSSENAVDLGTHNSHVQLTQGSTTYHAVLAAISTPMKANNIEDGLACNISTSCPSVCEGPEAQEGKFGTGQPSGVSDLSNDGPALRLYSSFPTVPLSKPDGDGSVTQISASFPVVPPPSELQVDASDGQGAGPSLHRAEDVGEVSRFSNVNIGEGNNSMSWLQAPQGRGKALVRRGRPRAWSAESREATRKRVKIDELYGDASPSIELTVFNTPPPSENPFSQEGIEKLANADAAHDTTILEPALLARMNAVAFPPPMNTVAFPPHMNAVAFPPPMNAVAFPPPMNAVAFPPPMNAVAFPPPMNAVAFPPPMNAVAFPPPMNAVAFSHPMTAVAFPPGTSASAKKEQNHIPVTITEHFVAPIPERIPIVTRCGGMTLNRNRCTHNVKDGSGFCVKHTKTDVDHSKRIDLGVPYYKQSDIIVFRCRGKTLSGNQCTHNCKDGGVYCGKHSDQAYGPPPRRIEEGVSYETPPPAIQHEIPGQALVQELVQEQAPIIAPPSPEEEDDDAAGARCIGRTRRTEERCSFRPKSGSVYCERHARQFREKGRLDYNMTYEAPSSSSPTASLSASLSLRKRRNQEVMHVADMSSSGTRERRSLSKAKDLFTDILNAGLLRGKVVSTDGKDLVGWICEEATKDTLSGETLLGLLAVEKERLRKVLIEDRKNLAIMKPPHFWQTKYSANLARTFSDMTDNQKVCAKGDQNDALQRNPSGRFSSDAHGASESCPSFAQMTRQGSESDRDVLACALCSKTFMEMPSLGKHWKEDHKKEAFLFQKGMACSQCGQEYTNKGGLLRHWKSTHPTLPIGDFSLIVCMLCDAKFKDFNLLWMHVEEQHSLEFSSADFAQHVRKGVLGAVHAVKCSACGEEFDTQLEFFNHNESAHNGLSSSDVYAVGDSPIAGPSSSRFTTNGNEASPSRFKCRFCGQKFNLLPDLGRHHQAEHGTKPKNKLATNVEGVEVKLPPLVKRTPLPNPETANSPPGKMLPLAELFTSRSSVGIAEQGEHQSSVEWPLQTPVPAVQPQTFNFRHLKTIAREKRKTEEKIVDAPPVPLLAQPPVPPPAPPPAPLIAPKKRRRRRKRMESLQNDKLVPMKKKLGRPAKKIVEHMKAVQQSQQERYGFNGQLANFRTVEEGVKAVSKMPLQRATNTNGLPTSAEKVTNTTGWPTSAEILEAARVACCKDSWYRELAKKHNYMHPDLHLQAGSLFTVMCPDIKWLEDTFLCPNQCLPFHVMEPAAPALEVDMAGFSEAPFKAQADHVNEIGPTSVETVNIKDVIKGKHLVINEDLSNGQEPVPIPCVIDEEVLRPCPCASCRENLANPSLDISEPWKCFNYTNKRLLDPSLGLDTESSKLGCACGEGKCNPSLCDHVLMFDNDNDHACDKSGVAMQGRFPYDAQGRIILEEGYMVYECNSSCSCREDCQNRVLQKGVRVKLEVFKSRHKGWAVRTAEPIRSGTFVCEYIGEVVNDREANRRGVRYDSEGCSYLYDIDAHLDLVVSRAGAKPFVIDATNHGNVARFINHSCAPNLINYEVLVESMDCQLAHIGFFARRDIGAGEELAYDYRYKLLPGKGTACHCGTSSCRGRLY